MKKKKNKKCLNSILELIKLFIQAGRACRRMKFKLKIASSAGSRDPIETGQAEIKLHQKFLSLQNEALKIGEQPKKIIFSSAKKAL